MTAWPRGDVEAIVALYAPSATYRALAFRGPDEGIEGVRRYLRENFGAEGVVSCQFADPVVSGNRAAVEWWASWVEDGRRLTMAGATMLRFDDEGRVLDHRDYWNEQQDRIEPYTGW
ncbi:MAG: nuclear transport factor 2 family protein [Candidatus Dormibacter sp.]